MDREELARALMETFLEELGEHVEALEANLVAWERDESGEGHVVLVKELFRSAHSLKGAARAVGLGPLEETCHALESLLGAVREGSAETSAAAFDAMLGAVDAVARAGEALRAGDPLDTDTLATAAARLDPSALSAPANRAAAVEAPPANRAAGVEAPPAHATAVVEAPPERVAAVADPAWAPGNGGTLRVASEKVDRLIAGTAALHGGIGRIGLLVAELDELRADILGLDDAGPAAKRLAHSLDALATRATRELRGVEQAAGSLDFEALALRMQPFSTVCAGLDRVVRDVAAASGRKAVLTVEGGNVELDRVVLASLRDPLVHLARNAVGHGIEVPSVRAAAGKPDAGLVTVRAELRGSRVEVTVTDDGAGIDLEALRARAARDGRTLPEHDDEATRLVFEAGFTTAGAVDAFAGRGVGLDVVRSRVESLHGTVDVASAQGNGTRFTLTVPLTVATTRALLVRAGGQVLAIPGTTVRALLRPGSGDVVSTGSGPAITHQGRLLPLFRLSAVLAAGAAAGQVGGRVPVVVLGAGDKDIALAVDALVAEEELTVKGFGARLRGIECYAAASVRPDGSCVLILNTAEVIRRALGRPAAQAPAAGQQASPSRLLVVDDSVTTRTLYRQVFEDAGFDVSVAADGLEALARLEAEGADAVLSDVEMPRMDGFALTSAIRASAALTSLPVVLVTALETDEGRARGLQAGADAYLPKSTYDHRHTLETIRSLL